MRRSRLRGLVAGLALAAGLLAADVVTKDWAESDLRRSGARTLFDGHLVLRYQTNSGIAFGLLQERLHPRKRPALILYAAVMSSGLAILLVVHLLRAGGGQRLTTSGLALLLAGALGNLRDRVRRGGVIDFIDLQAPGNVNWPAFNLADVFLAIGVVLCAVGLWHAQRRNAAAALDPASR